MSKEPKYRGISLFANVGIGETLLDSIGMEIVLSNELLVDRAKFYKESHPKSEVVVGDITDEEIYNKIIEKGKELKVNFGLFSPPCQGMSAASGHLRKVKENDPRNALIIKAIQTMLDLDLDFVLIENVRQMYNTSIKVNGKVVNIKDYLQDVCDTHGYKIKFGIFNTADYGTPQSRIRSFTRIYKPEFEWNDPIKKDRITVKQAIGDLPSLEANESSDIPYHYSRPHPARQIQWMKHTATGKTALDNTTNFPEKDGRRIRAFKTTYKRIEWDKPAPTITMANGSISSQNNVHPGNKKKDGTYSDARVLTPLELFRLTGLPEDWTPPKWASDSLIRKVIGEAIPPRMVKELFAGVKKLS